METVTTAAGKVRTEANAPAIAQEQRQEERKRCAPRVGMFVRDQGHDDVTCGIITQLFVDAADHPFCLIENTLTGKITMQYLDDVVCPFEGTIAASVASPMPGKAARDTISNPFFQMHQELRTFCYRRLIPLYKQLSSPNDSVDEVRDYISSLLFSVETSILRWEDDVEDGVIDPAIALSVAGITLSSPAKDTADPFYHLACRADKMLADASKAVRDFEMGSEEMRVFFRIETALNQIIQDFRNLSESVVSEKHSGPTEGYKTIGDTYPPHVAAVKLDGISEMLEKFISNDPKVEKLANRVGELAVELWDLDEPAAAKRIKKDASGQ